MKKKINYLIILLPVLFVLISLLATYGYGAWVITSTNSIEPVEITGLVDESLPLDSLKSSVVYNGSSRSPHEDIVNFDYENYKISYSTPSSSLLVAPAKAGTYTVKYENLTTHIVTRKEFTIETNTPVATLNSTLGLYYYSPSYDFDESLFTVTDEFGSTLSNVRFEFTNGAVTNDGSTLNSHKQTISYKCSVWDNVGNVASSNYDIVEGSFEISLYSVAFIDSVYYCRVESALLAAENQSGGQTVSIISGLHVNLFENTKVAENDVLLIPINTHTGTDVTTIPALASGEGFTSYNAYGRDEIDTADTNLIFVNNSILENYGSIKVNGIVSGGGGGYMAGHTSANYAQITLNGGKIISYFSSSIECYGYIIGSSPIDSKDDAQILIKNGASVTMPFIVDEHRGGSLFLNMAGGIAKYAGAAALGRVIEPEFKTSPFNRFHFNNIETDIKFDYGSKLIGRADLFANEQHNITFINVIGPNGYTKYLISLEQNSYVKVKYTHSTQKIDLDIYGSASLKPLSLSLQLVIMSISLNIKIVTDDILLPISWYYDISLNPLNDNSSSIVDLSMQNIKLLPGSNLVINKGVTLKSTTIVAYSEFNDPVASLSYPQMDPAKIEVNGTLDSNTTAGLITTDNKDAKLLTTNYSITTQELSDKDGNHSTYDHILALPSFESETQTLSLKDATSGGVYGVNANKYFALYDSYCWEQYTDYSKYTITYETGVPSLNLTGEVYVVPSNTYYTITEAILPTDSQFNYAGYQLEGWYVDQNYNTSAINHSFNGNITLYAKWVPKQYSINFLYCEVVDGVITPIDYANNYSISNNNTLTQFSSDYTGSYTLLDASVLLNSNALQFSGWYMNIGNNKVIKISSITKDIITNYESILEENEGLNLYCIVGSSKYNLINYYNDKSVLLESHIVENNSSHTISPALANYNEANSNGRGVIPKQFNSWTINGVNVSGSTTITTDVDIIAKFDSITYTLSYTAGSHTFGTDSINIYAADGTKLQSGAIIYYGETLTVKVSCKGVFSKCTYKLTNNSVSTTLKLDTEYSITVNGNINVKK